MPGPLPATDHRRRAIVIALLCLLFLIAIVSGWMWLRGAGSFSASAQPTAVESFLARWARQLATPEKVKERKNPLPATEANILAGADHYGDHCAICHDEDGSGKTDFGTNMYPKVPDLRLQATQHLSDGDLFSIIRNGIRLSGMPAFPDHTDQEIWQMVLLIRQTPHLTPQQLQAIRAAEPVEPEQHHHGAGEEQQPHHHDAGPEPQHHHEAGEH